MGTYRLITWALYPSGPGWPRQPLGPSDSAHPAMYNVLMYVAHCRVCRVLTCTRKIVFGSHLDRIKVAVTSRLHRGYIAFLHVGLPRYLCTSLSLCRSSAVSKCADLETGHTDCSRNMQYAICCVLHWFRLFLRHAAHLIAVTSSPSPHRRSLRCVRLLMSAAQSTRFKPPVPEDMSVKLMGDVIASVNGQYHKRWTDCI